jgi:ubiquinone/menaquinone biosynthesis C-methylase UbiE
MGSLVELITPYHTRTKRDYLARMVDDKVSCMEKAREYGFDYWDGDRRYGYGGYKYIPGYWTTLAKQLIVRYGLTNDSRVLDVGCGKAFLLHELSLLLPSAELRGFDVSGYALDHKPQQTHAGRTLLYEGRAEDERKYQYPDQYFDLVLAMGSLHNLENFDLAVAFREIERVGKQKYFWVESFRNAQEQFNLQCWALTCYQFLTPKAWEYEMHRNGYTGDYEFVYFE